MSVTRMRRILHLPEHCSPATALSMLPQVVTEAMRIAEETHQGRQTGAQKRQAVIDWVRDFYTHVPSSSTESSEEMGAVTLLATEVLVALVPPLIDQLVSVDNGHVHISAASHGCMSVCCPLAALALNKTRVR